MELNVLRDFERYLFTRDLSPGTVHTYIRVARLMEAYFLEHYHLSFDPDALHLLRGYMVSNWATSIMEHKISTRILYLQTARTFLRYLYTMQYVDFDLSSALPPVPNAKRHEQIHPESVNPKRNYTHEEIQQMLHLVPPNSLRNACIRAIIATLITTGLRVSELISLTVGDSKAENGFVMVARKGTHGNKVSVPFPSVLQSYLQDYFRFRTEKGFECEDSDPLFVSVRGNPLTRIAVYGLLSSIQKKADCPTGVHTFRHTALTQLAKDADPIVSRDVAGQKSIAITNRYLHSTQQEMLDAAEKLSVLLAE